MDATSITALTGLFVALGGGVGFLIKRADTRRQANEVLLIAHLTTELAKKEAELVRKEQTIKYLRAAYDICHQDGAAWREQLIANDVTPMPERWSPLPPQEDVL